ncbi:sensor protein SrrB [Lachnospiraceae bacterium]|nr:sensor protein SrrB [Lachnospiraceae bacterium]
MKNYNSLIIFSLLFYLTMTVCIGILLFTNIEKNEKYYKVEINRIMAEIKQPEDLDKINWEHYHEIQSVSYLSNSEIDRDKVMDFYSGENKKSSMIVPLIVDGDGIKGFLRFDYEKSTNTMQCLFWIEGTLFLMELFLVVVLLYLKKHLIQPFHRMEDMTYELSKGNLQGEMKAERNQYFGRFLWGLNGLRDELKISRKRELELQRERKLLLLSLSHDIKTPLNMIKLYTKALTDGIYTTNVERRNAYCQIGQKAEQIEKFVHEIVKTSKEDIVSIEVEKGAFYLKELVQWIEQFYGEKCALRKCNLSIGNYQNRILQGDLNRLFEVFENLLTNAFKYGDGRFIELTFYEEDYCQLIKVYNTGEPVSQKDFVHLFDSFFRGENTRGQQGNGLGLYICREIMHKIDGEIFAVCEAEGMAFIVVLPM